jgi:hypothetical protein
MYNLRLNEDAGCPKVADVDNFVGKESDVLIPGIFSPYLFTLFQESLLE